MLKAIRENKVFVVAEAGVNHNGNIETAKRLVDVAVEAGVNAVKFQTFKAERMISKFAQKAECQCKTTDKNETQFEMVKKLELDINVHKITVKRPGIGISPMKWDNIIGKKAKRNFVQDKLIEI